MMRVISIVGVFAGAILACAPPPSSFPGGMPNANIITREDIAAVSVSNAYDAIARLRPQFLNSHGRTTIYGSDTGYPQVYLNHQRYGDLQSLRTLDVHGISEIHYYNGTEATTRFGSGNVSGAIEVITDTR